MLLKQYPGRGHITLKEASTFIYNLYLSKGLEFKERSREKKSCQSNAQLCYVSLLDKETRNLMEFIYEIKNNLDGKQI